jgi:hypothetical protein
MADALQASPEGETAAGTSKPPGSLLDSGIDRSGALFGASARAVEISRALPGSWGPGGTYRYHAHDIYTWRAEGIAFVATLCPSIP